MRWRVEAIHHGDYMSVAIPTITRLQDQHDVNVSLGVGVDGYVLVYDHASGNFVLRDPRSFSGPWTVGLSRVGSGAFIRS